MAAQLLPFFAGIVMPLSTVGWCYFADSPPLASIQRHNRSPCISADGGVR